jgi:hypothetical protein
VFVLHPRPDLDAPQQAGVHELVERPVHGRPADVQAGRLQVFNELVWSASKWLCWLKM